MVFCYVIGDRIETDMELLVECSDIVIKIYYCWCCWIVNVAFEVLKCMIET